MNTKPGRRLRLSPLLLALAVSLAVAACGSSSGGGTKTSTSASASASSGRAKLAACLKQHGVTLPARRPGSGRGGFFGGGGTGTTGSGGSGTPPTGGFGGGGGAFFGNSKFRTAFKDCGGSFGHFRPGARGAAGRHFSGATLDKFVSCVRKHGYNLPKPNTSGGAIFPRSIESSKKFEAAARSCASLLRPSAPSATGTTTSSSS